jgi:putative Mg2+ transporter-C (MgtC) family protein
VLLSLQTVGALEAKIGWKRYPMLYEVRAEVGTTLPKLGIDPGEANALAEECQAARHRMFAAILKVLDAAGQRLQVLDRDNVAGLERVSFTVLATRKEHLRILSSLRASDATDQVVVFRDIEE